MATKILKPSQDLVVEWNRSGAGTNKDAVRVDNEYQQYTLQALNAAGVNSPLVEYDQFNLLEQSNELGTITNVTISCRVSIDNGATGVPIFSPRVYIYDGATFKQHGTTSYDAFPVGGAFISATHSMDTNPETSAAWEWTDFEYKTNVAPYGDLNGVLLGYDITVGSWPGSLNINVTECLLTITFERSDDRFWLKNS